MRPSVCCNEMPHSDLHQHVAVTRSNGRSLGTFQNAVFFWQSGNVVWKITFSFNIIILLSTLPLLQEPIQMHLNSDVTHFVVQGTAVK